MHQNNWAVSPATDDDYYLASGAVGGAGAVTLLQTVAPPLGTGVGYKIRFTSAGDSSARTWTIVGHKMGTAPGVVTTEAVTAPNATTADSANYYDTITSITASGAMTGNQKIGILGTSIALPRTRIFSVYYVGGASAGSVVVNLNSTTGRELLRVDTPASATATDSIYMPGGILVGGSAAISDCGIVTLTNLTFCTLICG